MQRMIKMIDLILETCRNKACDEKVEEDQDEYGDIRSKQT